MVVEKTKGRFTKIAVYTLNVQDEKSLFNNAQQTEARLYGPEEEV